MAEKLTGGKASILSESCPPGPVSCGPFSGPMAGDWYPLSSVNVPGWAEKALRVLLWTGMTAAFSKVFCSEFFFFFWHSTFLWKSVPGPEMRENGTPEIRVLTCKSSSKYYWVWRRQAISDFSFGGGGAP